jgi:hypothetical protein
MINTHSKYVQAEPFPTHMVVMLAIRLTVLDVMSGFWPVDALNGQVVGGRSDPVEFSCRSRCSVLR